MPKNYLGKYVIVTGASLGLGKAIAKKLASEGCNLILLSLPQEKLCDYCDELMEMYDIKILFYETDLSEADNIYQFAKWVVYQDVELAGLVNNAGLGGSCSFDKADTVSIDHMILVNIRALTLMTRIF